MNKKFLVILVSVLGVIALAAIWYFFVKRPADIVKSITNFGQCSAHFPITSTSPTECKTPDGRTFVKTLVVTTFPKTTTAVANPASVYCEEHGGTLNITDTKDGQVGMCTLSGGKVCEEWAYFRGECK